MVGYAKSCLLKAQRQLNGCSTVNEGLYPSGAYKLLIAAPFRRGGMSLPQCVLSFMLRIAAWKVTSGMKKISYALRLARDVSCDSRAWSNR
jgi:hypothetical protein